MDTLGPGVEVEFFHDHVADARALVERQAPFDAIVAMREWSVPSARHSRTLRKPPSQSQALGSPASWKDCFPCITLVRRLGSAPDEGHVGDVRSAPLLPLGPGTVSALATPPSWQAARPASAVPPSPRVVSRASEPLEHKEITFP
ncbi:hypothetical protein WME99_10620 [Sorangium sp. So ce136]|uniref:hypothetical protein n=1 Tax=Sorangium sp. So ce136 TaxID=3133284 RepID=UPI003F0E533F